MEPGPGRLELGLRRGDLVLVDTAPLVYLVEGGPSRGGAGTRGAVLPGGSPPGGSPPGASSGGRAGDAAPDRRARAAAAFFEAAEAGGLRLAASALAWTELLARPLREGDEALSDRFRSFLADSRRFYLAPVDAAIADAAAALRGRRRLELADAVQIATALVLGAAAVLTNDEAWRRVPDCPRVILLDELAFELES